MRDRLKRLTAFICACLLSFSALPAAAESEPVYSDWFSMPDKQQEEIAPEAETEEEPETSGEVKTIPAGETVRNDHGTFTALADVPEGTGLHVEEYAPTEAEEAQVRELAGENAQLVWLDVYLAAEEEKIETAADVTLQMDLTLPEAPERAGKTGRTELREVRVFHVREKAAGDTRKLMSVRSSDTALEELAADHETADGVLQTVSFTTNSFSGFAIAYTVDFLYEGYTYSLFGNGWMTLSRLVSLLQITDRDGTALDMADVERVDFTDTSLVLPEAVTETKSLAEVRRGAGLAEGGTEEEQTTVTAPDWVLFSLKPFTSREKLTVTTRSGDVFVIDVTDAPTDPWYIDDDGVLHIQSDSAMNFSSSSGAPWYKERLNITSIIVHEGVTKIPSYFVGNKSNSNLYPSLTSVSLADSVTSIGTKSFRYCTSLKTVELGSGIRSIPDNTFYNCSGLENINLENVKTIGTSAFNGCSKLREAEFGDELTSIGNNAFYNCAGLESVSIPGSVSSIGSGAFQNCTGLKEARFAETNLMTSLPSSLFSGCKNLEEVDLPQDLSSIGDKAFQDCSSLTEIKFPSSLEKIGTSAFSGCKALAKADLPRYLKEIGNTAFSGCSALQEVKFPSGLTKIGDSAYAGCASIGAVELPGSVTTLGTGAFQGCTGLEEANLSNLTLTTLPESILAGCSSLIDARLPETLDSIGKKAFNGCSALPEIQLPKSVNTIQDSAFYGCRRLAVINGSEAGIIVLPDSITSVGDWAFRDCDAFVSVTVPDTVTSLGTYALAECDNLESAEITAGISEIPNGIFSSDPKLKNIVFRGNIEKIPDYAFNGCTSLVNFPLWEGLKGIGKCAFQNCTGLKPVLEFPSTLQSIESSAYQGCNQVTSVDFADNSQLNSIGSNAFYNLPNLKTVELPDTVKTIGESAFSNCQQAKFSGMPTSLETVGKSAFSQCYGLTELHFPASLKTIGDSAFYGNTSYSKINSVTFADGCVLTTIGNYAFCNQNKIQDLDLPDQLTTIPVQAFMNCSGLKNVDFPKSLKTISESAFNGCTGLQELDFPVSLELIDSSAFASCKALKELVFPENGNLTTIRSSAFSSCTALKEVVFPENGNLKTIGSSAFSSCTGLKSVSIPDTVTSIGSSCFKNCTALENVGLSGSLTSIPYQAFIKCSALKKIDIPDQVKTIGEYAFSGCINLESVKFPENLTTISQRAFSSYLTPQYSDYASSCLRLQKAILPDNTSTINSSAFNNCQELKTVRIPSAASTISADVLDNCKNLENLIWDVKSKEFTNLTMSNVPKFTLTIGRNVDSITDGTLRALTGKGAKLLAFEGENWLTLPSTNGLPLPRPQNSLEEGNYYADAQGALYQIKDGEAILVYVPDGLTGYTIPASIPSENGDKIPVTGVKDNAFALAQALTSVTIESPESMTRIDPFAFAYAANLESINGETTVGGATALFTGTTPGVRAFYETKLTDDNPTIPLTGQLMYDAANNVEDRVKGWSDTVQLAISQSTFTWRGKDGVRPAQGMMENDEVTKAFLAYTGEENVTTIEISNDISAPVIKGDKIRVYFQLDDGGKLNYAPGEYSAVVASRNASSGDLEPTGEEMPVHVRATDAKGVFYVEFDRPGNGKTVSFDVKTNFASPTTGGGNLTVWAEYMNAQTAAETAGIARNPQPKHQTVNWTTKKNEFDFSKTTGTAKIGATVGSNGVAYVKGDTFTIDLKRTGNVLEKVGRDHMKSVDFTDTFILPEGVKLNPAIIEEIREKRIRYSGVGGSIVYITSPSLGTIFSLQKKLTVNPQLVELSLDDQEQPVLTWRAVNPNPNYDASGAEMLEHNVVVTVFDKVFCLEDSEKPNTDYIIKNNLDAKEHFCYSGDAEQHAEAIYTVNSGFAALEFTKTTPSSAYRGESAPYTITLNSTGVLPVTARELTKLTDVIDSSDKMHYLDAAGIWYMFTEGMYPEALKLTISDATLYGGSGSTALRETKNEVITTNHGTARTDQENTGYGTHYSGKAVMNTTYEKTGNTFTFGLEDGKLRYRLQNSAGGEIASGTVNSAASLQAMFDDQGFYVTQKTLYTVEWDFANKYPGLSIPGGQSVAIKIPTRYKDTFMHLNSDATEVDNNSTSNKKNTAYAYFGGTSKGASASSWHGNDLSLSKGRSTIESHRYTDQYTDLEVPDVVQYTVSAKHTGSARYEVMPVTDCMTRKQLLLVPVTENEGTSWAEGLEKRTVGDAEYYVLNREGTYRDVWTGNAWADRVEYGRDEEGEYYTRIFWYIPNFGGSATYSLVYKAATIQNPVIPLTRAYDLRNESWIGDHDGHRLWDFVEGYGIYQTEPLVLWWNKRIVERVGDTSAGSDYCNVTQGKQVVYRFTFFNDQRKNFTIQGKDIYDILPKYSSAHTWKKNENIRVVYSGFETNDPEGNKWEIVTHNSSTMEQKIVWDDDFRMTCTDPNGIGYVYVIADFPAGTKWENYVQKYQNSELYNTLYLRNNGLNFDEMSVSHDLADHLRARLQKGVYTTGGEMLSGGTWTDVYNSGEDARLIYDNDDTIRRKVYYYITLHNDGWTNLYLNPIQDVLPKGFTFDRASVVSSSYATVTKGTGPALSYVYTYSYASYRSSVTSSVSTTEDGCERVTLNLIPYADNGSSYLQYNRRLGKYYLKPGQAAVLRVECYTNKIEETQDIAVNRATMPFYDFYNQGTDIDSGTSTAANSGGTKNDGGCEVLDTTEARGMGFDVSGANAATEWMYSEVTVTRSQIQPGLLKILEKKITMTSDMVEEEDYDPSSINPTDRLVWSVTAFDESVNSITDYAITDRLPSPFNFSREVTFRQYYNDSTGASDITLFRIDREVTTELDGRKIISDHFTITPDGSETGIPAEINGDPVEIRIPNRNRNVSDKKQELTLYVAISRDAESGDEIMSIRFTDEELCIPATGRVVLKYESENLSGVLQNKMLQNTAYVTPLKQVWDGSVSEGNLTNYTTPYSNEHTQSVRNSAHIVASYGGITSSKKGVQEKGSTASANSEATTNYITLFEKEREFVYSLSVTNDNNDPIKKIVLIDNLPEKNDHTVFQDDDPRNSEFRVLLADDPAFTLTVKKNGQTAENTVPAGYYRIELGTRTSFKDEDWKGSIAADWTEPGSLSGEARQALIRNARSIRLVFEDNEKDYWSNIFLPGATITLSFAARVDTEDPEVQPGRIAWNSFGYHFTIKGRMIDQEAAPLVVGVRLPDYPNFRKELINTRGAAYETEHEEKFTYLMYEGSRLTINGTTREAVIGTVENNTRNYVLAEVTVPQGASRSGEPVSLNDTTGRMWNSDERRYEDKPWRMTDGKTYQVIELPAERYSPYSWNGTRGASFSFTYKANDEALAIRSVNMHDDWSLKLRKQDQFGTAVGSAVFAVYSPIGQEAWMQEYIELEGGHQLRYTTEELQGLYDGKTLAELNEAFGVELETKPDYVKTDSGTDYRLKAILKTPGHGTIQLDNLTGESYLYQELLAPEHYEADTTLRSVKRGTGGAGTVITVNAVNRYLASGTAQIHTNKKLSGRSLKPGEFSFRLEGFNIETKTPFDDGDAGMPPMPQENLTVLNGTDGSAVFGRITLDQDDIGKTYYYQISEIIPEDSKKDPHIVYDGRKYIAKMTVRDLGEGKIGTDISYSWIDEIGQEIASEEGAEFRNAYEDDTEISLKVRKHLTGRPWREGETFTFVLAGAANPEDSEAPKDERRLTVRTGNEDTLVLTVPFDADYNEQTWYYTLREEVSDAAIGYSRATGKPIQAPKSPTSRLKTDLTYKRYREMTDEEKQTLGLTDAGSILWKDNGIAFDSTEHSVVVRLACNESTGEMDASLTVDGKIPDEKTETVFTNSFVPDNADIKVPVAKTMTGRPWLRGDRFVFTISAEDGAPEPTEPEAVIERGIINNNPVRTGQFSLSFKWDDLKNEDGTYATEKEFIYTVREKTDPDAEGATVIRDAEGNITSYKLDQVTYDLREEKIRILLKEQGGKMAAELYFRDDRGEWIQGEELTTAFENTYATELIGFPAKIRKQFNNGLYQPGEGSFSFALLDSENKPALDSDGKPIRLTMDLSEAADGVLEAKRIDVKLGDGVTLDKTKTYTFYLQEVIPDDAAAHDRDGDMLDSTGGKRTDEKGTPLTYGLYSSMTDAERAALSLPADFCWKKDQVTYDTQKIKLTVLISLNRVTYRLEPTVTYTPDSRKANEALFSNIRTAEKIVLRVRKQLAGRPFAEGESFRFEITPAESTAPLRTENGRYTKLTADAGKETDAVFDALVFTVEDLGGAETKDFSYRIHEVIPEKAEARDAQGTVLKDAEGKPLTYEKASEEQKASAEIRWYDRGIAYAADRIVKVRVSLTEEGTLQLSVPQE